MIDIVPSILAKQRRVLCDALQAAVFMLNVSGSQSHRHHKHPASDICLASHEHLCAQAVHVEQRRPTEIAGAFQSPAAVGSRLSDGCLLQLPAESVRPLQEPQAESLALQHCQTWQA